jgi:nucleoside-diphosphate-sugar epimerase
MMGTVKKRVGEAINLMSETEISMLDLANRIIELTGNGTKIVSRPRGD